MNNLLKNITSKRFILNNRSAVFFHAIGDDGFCGTISCLMNHKFHFSDIRFDENDVLIDIGCNIGLVSMVAAILNPSIRVYSFDPSPVSIYCLRNAANANGLHQIQSFQVAVGDKNEKDVSFFSNGQNISCIVREGLNNDDPVPASVANMISIDEIFDSPLLGVGKVKYLKMDIEGGEYAIFDRLFTERQDILDRVEYWHVEIHQKPGRDHEKLKNQLIARFGTKVFFDT